MSETLRYYGWKTKERRTGANEGGLGESASGSARDDFPGGAALPICTKITHAQWLGVKAGYEKRRVCADNWQTCA